MRETTASRTGTSWLLRRLLLAIPTLIGITVVTFALSRLAPGGPLSALLDTAEGRALTRDQLAQTERLLGLDRPLPAQYLDWLGRFVRLDFGDSLVGDLRPVREKVMEALKVSFALQSAALLLMYLIGVPLGVWSAAREGTLRERAAGAALFALHSMPMLLIATLLIAALCTGPDAPLPLVGLRTPGLQAGSAWESLADLLRHALLPVACLTLSGLAAVTRFTRAGVIEALRQPFVQAARARGLPERLVLARHALRNGLVPAVTLLGNLIPWLVGGSVVIETLFGIPGLGRLATDSILARDYPTVMALSVLVGVVTMAGFVVVDLLYARLDRRLELT